MLSGATMRVSIRPAGTPALSVSILLGEHRSSAATWQRPRPNLEHWLFYHHLLDVDDKLSLAPKYILWRPSGGPGGRAWLSRRRRVLKEQAVTPSEGLPAVCPRP